MFRSATDHHQRTYLFLVKVTELKMWIFIRGNVVMRQHASPHQTPRKNKTC
jgi:hypothetical protein